MDTLFSQNIRPGYTFQLYNEQEVSFIDPNGYAWLTVSPLKYRQKSAIIKLVHHPEINSVPVFQWMPEYNATLDSLVIPLIDKESMIDRVYA